MPEFTVDMRTLDLSRADQQPVTGKHVRNLQAVLNIFLSAGNSSSADQLADTEGRPPPPLAIDGIAGPKTREALLQFQRVVAIAEDAIAGPVTWKTLIELPVTA